ncbi:MAG TPA: GTP-binding protein [Stellaceae bacterium]|jgi:G3E family GTPase|nr:GTP-binding protein [Stellaceae bacterium]
MAARDILPTTVLTGFLGSGKTTLLRRVLASPDFADTAVVINEVGEISIDHYLVDFVEGNVVELPGGCLCCAVREDLAKTLRELIDRRDAGTVRPFRRVVIETTGLADPAPILYTLGADPMLDQRLSLARVVTLVDAVNGAASLARYAEAARQIAVADAIVVSKTDLAPLSAELEARLDALNPGAERINNAPSPPLRGGEGWGEVGDSTGARPPHPPTALRRAPPSPPNGRRGSEAAILFGAGARQYTVPAPPHAAHSHDIDTFAVILGGKISRLDFAVALGGLAQQRGYDLLRVKGLVAFADRPGQPAVVQAAQHAMFAPEWLDAWPDADRRSRLVFVVHDIPRAEILAHFAFASPTLLH